MSFSTVFFRSSRHQTEMSSNLGPNRTLAGQFLH